MSLRPPQRRSLEILDRATEIVPPKKGTELGAALAARCSEFPTVTDFERDFPFLCFALATGVGKTRSWAPSSAICTWRTASSTSEEDARNVLIYHQKQLEEFIHAYTEVQAKKEAAVTWCDRATNHALANGGKPWKYVLIPHDAIAENMTLAALVSQFAPAP